MAPPFKSKSQQRKFGELMQQGKIKKSTFDEFAHATPDIKDLPERITPQKPTGIDRIKAIKKAKKI